MFCWTIIIGIIFLDTVFTLIDIGTFDKDEGGPHS